MSDDDKRVSPDTLVHFEFTRTPGADPATLDVTIEEFIDRDDLATMARDKVDDVIRECFIEWLVEQVEDSAAWWIGDSDDE